MEINRHSRSSRSASACCAYCHDMIVDEGHTCPSCQTVLHGDCQRELGRCPTLGCAEAIRPPEPVVFPITSRPGPAETSPRNPLAFIGLSPSRSNESELSVFTPISALISKTLMLLGLGVVFLSVLRFSGLRLAAALSPMSAAYNPWWILALPILAFVSFRIVQRFHRAWQEPG